MAGTLEIITIPHPTLRKKAVEVDRVDKKLYQFMSQLEQTLDATRNPTGVGLAAPQVDKLWRVFSTRLPLSASKSQMTLRTFINPIIAKTSPRQVLGENADDPDMEGCLSIPLLYGPVPRWEWVELEYQTIENDQLVTASERFFDFAARVVQHELDHLDGILFTDHVLKHGLPLFRHSKTKKWEEVDPSLIEGI